MFLLPELEHAILLCFTAPQNQSHKLPTLNMTTVWNKTLKTAIITPPSFYFDTVVEYTKTLYTICSYFSDAVAWTIFHASQKVRSWLSPARKKWIKTQADLQTIAEINDSSNYSHCFCFTYDAVLLRGSGLQIILYTQETYRSFSHSNVKWNGEQWLCLLEKVIYK